MSYCLKEAWEKRPHIKWLHSDKMSRVQKSRSSGHVWLGAGRLGGMSDIWRERFFPEVMNRFWNRLLWESHTSITKLKNITELYGLYRWVVQHAQHISVEMFRKHGCFAGSLSETLPQHWMEFSTARLRHLRPYYLGLGNDPFTTYF